MDSAWQREWSWFIWSKWKNNFSVGALLLLLAAKEQVERSSMKKSNLCRKDCFQLHAQRKALQLIIEVVVRVFVETQRRDTYYRNDPSKYGLGFHEWRSVYKGTCNSNTCGCLKQIIKLKWMQRKHTDAWSNALLEKGFARALRIWPFLDTESANAVFC